MPDDNVYDLFADNDGDEETEAVDPALVAFMDQQSAEFNEKAEKEFADRHGFVHKCRCDLDFTEGNMVEVTECYANMTIQALETCALLNQENKVLRLIIANAMGDNSSESSNEPEENTDAGDSDDGYPDTFA